MNFSQKNVLITGGSRGIGQATAFAFARAGAQVAIVYRSDEKAARLTIDTLAGNNHLAIQADISNPESVRQMINQVMRAFGRLDIVVNNAAVFDAQPIDQSSYEHWQQSWAHTLGVNLLGAANVCYCAAQYMMQQRSGCIVNVSSRGAYRGEPDSPAYGASKGGLNAMSQSLAKSLGKYDVTVHAVAPGFVDTEMAQHLLDGPEGDGIRAQSPMGRVARPDEVAHAILFLASEGAVFTSGAILDLNGASYFR
ncbi:MAG: SDR family oxidoreductase [Bacteroidota bacterium]